MAERKKSSGLVAAVDAEILHAVGLGALLGTVGMGIGLIANTVIIAGTTAALAMGIGAAVGITAMIGSVVLSRKAQEQSIKAQPPVVMIQAQGIAHAPEMAQEVSATPGKFAQKILDERNMQQEVMR